MSPASGPHGDTENLVAFHLTAFVRQHPLGRIYVGETGFIVGRDPDTVRGADVAFLTSERVARVPEKGFVPFAPDLAVEVVSPDDTWTEVREKVGEWLAGGTRLVWVVDPGSRTVDVFAQDLHASFGVGDTLSGGEVIPGFVVPVRELFP